MKEKENIPILIKNKLERVANDNLCSNFIFWSSDEDKILLKIKNLKENKSKFITNIPLQFIPSKTTNDEINFFIDNAYFITPELSNFISEGSCLRFDSILYVKNDDFEKKDIYFEKCLNLVKGIEVIQKSNFVDGTINFDITKYKTIIFNSDNPSEIIFYSMVSQFLGVNIYNLNKDIEYIAGFDFAEIDSSFSQKNISIRSFILFTLNQKFQKKEFSCKNIVNAVYKYQNEIQNIATELLNNYNPKINDNLWCNLHSENRFQLLTCFSLVNQLKRTQFLFRNIAILLECTLRDFYLPRIYSLVETFPDDWISHLVESFSLIDLNSNSHKEKALEGLFQIIIHCALEKNNNTLSSDYFTKITQNKLFKNTYHSDSLKKVIEIQNVKDFPNLQLDNQNLKESKFITKLFASFIDISDFNSYFDIIANINGPRSIGVCESVFQIWLLRNNFFNFVNFFDSNRKYPHNLSQKILLHGLDFKKSSNVTAAKYLLLYSDSKNFEKSKITLTEKKFFSLYQDSYVDTGYAESLLNESSSKDVSIILKMLYLSFCPTLIKKNKAFFSENLSSFLEHERLISLPSIFVCFLCCITFSIQDYQNHEIVIRYYSQIGLPHHDIYSFIINKYTTSL